MAELPRYRPLGVRIGSMPSVDLTQAGRAQAQVYGTIDKALGQMADYLYEKEVERATAAGAKYGAENAPTVAQLNEAMESGNSITGQVIADDTIFGQAARKSAIDVVSINAETAARNAITQLRMDATASDMTPTDFQVQLNGLIDGYSSVVSGVDPIAGRKLEAALAVTANSNLLAYSKEQQEKTEARQSIAVELDFTDNILPGVDAVVENGALISPDGTITSVEDQLDVLRSRALTLASAIADEEKATSFMKRFDERITKAITGAVVSYGMDSPRVRMKEFRTGEIENPQIARLWNSLDDTQQDAMYKALRDEIKAENALTLSEERIVDLREKEREDGLIKIINNGLRAGTDVSKELEELSFLNPILHEQMISIRDTQGGVDDAETMNYLNVMAANGTLTSEDVLAAMEDRRITTATGDKYFTKIKNRKDERYTRASRMLSRAYGSPDKILVGRALVGDEIKRSQQFNEHMDEIDMRMDADPNFDPLQYAKDITESLSDTVSVNREIQDLAKDITDRLGTSFPAIKILKNTDSRIAEAQRLLEVPYDPGGIFTGQTGLNDQQRIVLLDILSDLRKLEQMEAGQ